MSYTKILGHGKFNRSSVMIMYKGNNCHNCKCENKLMLAFDNSDREYSSIILCKNCIIKFIDEYSDLKHNKRCYYCEDYFEELIIRNITHDTPGGIKTEKFEFCDECNRLHDQSKEDSENLSYAEMTKRKI